MLWRGNLKHSGLGEEEKGCFPLSVSIYIILFIIISHKWLGRVTFIHRNNPPEHCMLTELGLWPVLVGMKYSLVTTYFYFMFLWKSAAFVPTERGLKKGVGVVLLKPYLHWNVSWPVLVDRAMQLLFYKAICKFAASYIFRSLF